MGTQWPTLIHALVRRHSEKPEVFQEMIDRYFPTLPKIELHGRAPSSGPVGTFGAQKLLRKPRRRMCIDLTDRCRPLSRELATEDQGQ
jgi:N6-adenosine-specific RNA methylase IME4